MTSLTVFSSARTSKFGMLRARPSGFCASLLRAEGFFHRGCSETACAPTVSEASRGLNSQGERGKASFCAGFIVPILRGGSNPSLPKIEGNNTRKERVAEGREGKSIRDRKRWRK